MIMKVRIRCAPSSGTSISVAKLANRPRYTVTKIDAEMSAR